MEELTSKPRKRRRSNIQLDGDVMQALEELVCQYGFGNVNITALMKHAGIEANVFYKRYGSMDKLYAMLAKQYDFWLNDTVEISSLHTMGPKMFFAETLKKLYSELSGNEIMQKLLLWELTSDNETTRQSAQMRDLLNLSLVTFYEKMFKPAQINIKGIVAALISGIYYLTLHKERAEFCAIDFSTPEGKKCFFDAIDSLADILFDRLEVRKEKREIALRMVADGLTEANICKYLAVNKKDLRALCANP